MAAVRLGLPKASRTQALGLYRGDGWRERPHARTRRPVRDKAWLVAESEEEEGCGPSGRRHKEEKGGCCPRLGFGLGPRRRGRPATALGLEERNGQAPEQAESKEGWAFRPETVKTGFPFFFLFIYQALRILFKRT